MGDAARAPDPGDEDERLELHGGQVTPKEAARYEHSDAQRGVAVAVGARFNRQPGGGGPGGWWIATEVEVEYPGWTFLHDLAGWRRDGLEAKPTGRPVRQVPDWVCEILSTNRKHDTVSVPYAGIVAQYAIPGENGHGLYKRLESVQHQFSCFHSTYRKTGIAVVPPPAALGTPCHMP